MDFLENGESANWKNEQFLFLFAWFAKGIWFSAPSMLCAHDACVSLPLPGEKKVKFLSNITAFVMSLYSNASINPVSPLCGISVVGLSMHMTLRTDRQKVS